MDSGETAPCGRGAEGERRSSQAKGTGSGRYSEKAGSPATEGATCPGWGGESLRSGYGGAKQRLCALFLLPKNGTNLKEELRK